MVVLFFPLAFNRIGKAPTFGFLGIMALAQAFFLWRFVPETKNMTLEQIEEQWKNTGNRLVGVDKEDHDKVSR